MKSLQSPIRDRGIRENDREFCLFSRRGLIKPTLGPTLGWFYR